jgi:nicotinamidase-related amidase
MTRALMLIDVQRNMLEPPTPVPAAASIREVVIAGMQSNYCVAESSRGALKHGLQAILASGAHATYDENEPASAISAQIERELATEGISILSFRKVSFGEAA